MAITRSRLQLQNNKEKIEKSTPTFSNRKIIDAEKK